MLAHSVKIGLRTTVSPSPTPLLTPAAIQRFHDIWVARKSISVDGPDAASHDAIRGVEGSFALAVRALGTARAVGLETQINTTVTRLNRHQLGGKCGYCPYHKLCGGSRARAYALTGDYMAAEPR